MKDKTRDFYNKASTEYDRAYAGFRGKYITRFEKEKVLDALDIKQGDLVLDAGTGTGEYALEMSKRGAIVVGMDISEEMIRIAHSKNHNGNIHFIIADAGHPPFRVGFNKIVGVGLIEYLEKEHFVELVKCMEKEGVAIFTGVVNSYCVWKPILRKLLSKKGLPYKSIGRSYFDFSKEATVVNYRRYFLIPPSFLKLVGNSLGDKFERILYHVAFLLECTPLRVLGTNVFVKIRKLDEP